MKYIPLIWAGLRRRPTRTIFTFLSVLVGFILFGVLAGLNGYVARALERSRLDRLIVLASFGGGMPVNYQEKIAAIPGTILVIPCGAFGGYWQTPKNGGVGIIATDERYFQAYSELTSTRAEIEKLTHTRMGAIVGTALLKRYHWKVGDTISIITPRTPMKGGGSTWTFEILSSVDITGDPGDAQQFIVNYKYLDEARAKGAGTADRFIVRIADPAKAGLISHAIDAQLANSPAPTRTMSEKAILQSSLQNLGDLNYFVHAIVSAVLFMLLFITGSTIMQSVMERMPEFAMLKAMGFSDVNMFGLVLAEAVAPCILAGLLGLLTVKTVEPIIQSQSKGNIAAYIGVMQMSWEALGVGLAITFAMAVIACIIPVLRVKQLSVVDALAGR